MVDRWSLSRSTGPPISVAGVDIVGDVYDPAFQRAVKAIEPRLILCCNMLEQVVDRARFAAACSSLMPPGGFLLLSVPYSFPYHMDPIDTFYRPSPAELSALFPEWETLESGIVVEDASYLGDLRRRRWNARDLFDFAVVGAVRFTMPWWRFPCWKNRLHPMLWLWRPYRDTYAQLRKRARGGRDRGLDSRRTCDQDRAARWDGGFR